MPRYEDVLTTVELGTAAVKACMGGIRKDRSMELLGCQVVPNSHAVRKGEIVTARRALDQLEETLNLLEAESGRAVGPTYLAVTGGHFGTVNAQGTIPITSEDQIVTEDDLIVATQHARELSLPPDKLLVHSYQRTYVLDGSRHLSNPLGMVANRLSADIHNIYGDRNRIEAMLRLLLTQAGDDIREIAFSGIADFHALEPETAARQGGVLLIDVGAGVSEYVLFHEDGCMHSGQLTIGCDQLANDLALGLQIPIEFARQLVVEHGAATLMPDDVRRLVAVPAGGNVEREAPLSNIHKIMELRLQELFELICEDLERHNVRALISEGIILGGGGALIPRLPELAQQVFDTPARVAVPRRLEGMDEDHLDPRLLTPIGLLLLAQQFRRIDMLNRQPLHKMIRQEVGSIIDLARRAIKL